MSRPLHEFRRSAPLFVTTGFLAALNLAASPAAHAEGIAKSGPDCPVQGHILAVGQNISLPVAMGSEAITVKNLGKINFFNRVFNLPGFPTEPAAEIDLTKSPLIPSWGPHQIDGKLPGHRLDSETVSGTIDIVSGLKGEAGEYNVTTAPDRLSGDIDVTICDGPPTTSGFDQPPPSLNTQPPSTPVPGTEMV